MGLAGVYIQKENMPEAKKLMIRALELSTDVLGKKHAYVASIYTQVFLSVFHLSINDKVLPPLNQ